MLAQQRAFSKKTWPGIWSNACCGHPYPHEPLLDAANRRLKEELDLEGIDLTIALPNFRYRAQYDGIVENEICPVLIGKCQQKTNPNPSEVAAIDWIPWQAFANACNATTDTYLDSFSPWSLMEGRLLLNFPDLNDFITRSADT